MMASDTEKDQTKAKAGKDPAKAPETEKTPAKAPETEKTPAKTEKEPAKTEKTPAKTEKEPAKTEKTPAKTEKEPSKTEKTPAKTEKGPGPAKVPKTDKGAAKAEKGSANAPKAGKDPAKAKTPKTGKGPAKPKPPTTGKDPAKAKPRKAAKGPTKTSKTEKDPAKTATVKDSAKAPSKTKKKISEKVAKKGDKTNAKGAKKDPLKGVKEGTGKVAKKSAMELKKKKNNGRIQLGKVRFGRKKRAIIRKIVKPHLKKFEKKEKKPIYVTKPIGGEKNGGTRTVLVKKPPNYYPAQPKKRRRPKMKKVCIPKLKKSLTPGAICIMVAGPHKGKRVVFLKQMKSGLCLITGPFTLNNCPLRRINQIYLIGTAVKVDLGEDFKVPEHLNDDYFKRVRLNNKKPKKDGGDIFTTKAKKYRVTKTKKADQKIVDIPVLKAIKKHKEYKMLCAYLSTKFSIRNHQFPHLLKF